MFHKRLLAAVFIAFAVLLSACESGGSTTTTGGTKVNGGAAKYALPPNTTPNYIFLMEPPQFNSNIWGQFVELMWMQLYFFIDKDGNQSTTRGASRTSPHSPRTARPRR
jgi:peptide/nickel transport system substrate-binding protein